MPSPTRVDDLYRAYQENRRAGQTVSAAQLCRDCPDLLPELQRRIERDSCGAVALAAASEAGGRSRQAVRPDPPLPPAEPHVDTDLGNCAWLVWDLRRSNLIDRARLDPLVRDFLHGHPGAEGPDLAAHLVALGLLTELQAEGLLNGKSQGFVLGPFTLLDALGAGSMGTVYKARSKNDNNGYAIKVLPRRSVWNVRLARRWVRSFDQCRQPADVPFVDVGTSGGMHYLAWPLVEGTTLDQVVQKQGRLPVGQAAAYAVQAAEGLELCHQQGLFHGLLKPGNLMVGTDGQLRILDFGIGCLLAETEGESLVDTMSTANSVNSGLDCASPESIVDPTNLSAIGDQYSLGCVLYYCLAGRYPFPDGTTVEKMVCHQFQEPTPLKEAAPGVPDALAEVVGRMMQKEPSARYASYPEVIEALRPFASPVPAPRGSRQVPRLVLPASALALRPPSRSVPRLPQPAAPAEPPAPSGSAAGSAALFVMALAGAAAAGWFFFLR